MLGSSATVISFEEEPMSMKMRTKKELIVAGCHGTSAELLERNKHVRKKEPMKMRWIEKKIRVKASPSIPAQVIFSDERRIQPVKEKALPRQDP